MDRNVLYHPELAGQHATSSPFLPLAVLNATTASSLHGHESRLPLPAVPAW